MTKLAIAADAIPLVSTTAERAGKFPSPDTNQRVHNLETGTIDRWDGAAWVSTPLTLPTSLAGLTLTAPLLAPNGTNSAPSIALANDPDTGFYSAGTGLFSLVIGGTVIGSFQAGTTSFLNTVQADGLTVENIAQFDGQVLIDSNEVTFGAADSAGTGYRLLRVPNA